MKYLEEINENEISLSLKPDVEFDRFAEQMLSLDRTTYNKIFDDPQERAKFSMLSTMEKLALFSPEFQTQLKELHDNFCAHKKTVHSLSSGVYRLGHLTGATYKEIAERLEAALQKQFSRSYISKLFRVGQMLSAAPALAVISDTEKLAELSRIEKRPNLF